MRKYVINPKSFLVNSSLSLHFPSFLIGDKSKRSIKRECFEEAYKAFLKKMHRFYKSDEVVNENTLHHLLAAVVDSKRELVRE